MLMNFLKRWGPVLMFVVVLGLCVGFVMFTLADPRSEPDVTNALNSKQAVEQALGKGKVSPAYIASDEQAAKIKFVEALKTNIDRVERVKRTPDEPIGVNVSYPVPVRPKSEPPPPPMGQDDLVAKMPYLEDAKFKAEEARGKVYVKCELPKKTEDAYVMMEPVRFEIFRGLSKDKIDTSKPWGTIEVGLEVPPAPKAAAAAPGTPAAAAPAEEESTRRRKKTTGATDAPSGRGAKPAPEVALPEFERAYRDTKDVAQLTEYFYQVRLVAVFTSTDLKKVMSKRADGTQFELVHHKPTDKNLTPVASTNSGVLLYATPLTQPFSAKTPSNFQLRVSGITGEVPPIGTVRNPANHDNKKVKVSFEVNVWVNDLADWKNVLITEVTEGDMVSGKIKYSKAGEQQEYDFTKDLGYKLYEVNMEESDSAVAKTKIPVEAVVLENQKIVALIKKLDSVVATKPEAAKLNPYEKFYKSGKLTTEKESVKNFDKIIQAQEREMKKLREAPAPAAAPSAPAAPAGAAPSIPQPRGQQ